MDKFNPAIMNPASIVLPSNNKIEHFTNNFNFLYLIIFILIIIIVIQYIINSRRLKN